MIGNAVLPYRIVITKDKVVTETGIFRHYFYEVAAVIKVNSMFTPEVKVSLHSVYMYNEDKAGIDDTIIDNLISSVKRFTGILSLRESEAVDLLKELIEVFNGKNSRTYFYDKDGNEVDLLLLKMVQNETSS